MRFSHPPSFAAWKHHEAREGFEVTFFHRQRDGWQLEGSTTAVEDGQGWTVSYDLLLDTSWHTLRARVTSQTGDGQHTVDVQQVSAGSWLVNGSPAPQFDGCQDVDLEASAMTNTLPVHRLGLEVDESGLVLSYPGLATRHH